MASNGHDFINENLKARVTVPIIPSLSHFEKYLKKSFEKKWLSNFGPCYDKLKSSLGIYLRAPNIELFSSGTQALICGLRNLGVSGEIITTPFTFPATVNAIRWAGLKPVFADIDKETLTISPSSVESLIDKNTTAILGVDVYGNRCNHAELSRIAHAHGLKLAYDSAHSFSPEMFSLKDHCSGDFHMISFHATKLFHTCEGGALVFENSERSEELKRLQNFGFTGEDSFIEAGTNAKMSELHAAMGLAVLDEVELERTHRAELAKVYRSIFQGDSSICIHPLEEFSASYTYFTLLFDFEQGSEKRELAYSKLIENGYGARRYFNPLCCDVKCHSDSRRCALETAKWAVSRVLCLPLHSYVSIEDAEKIAQVVMES